METTPPPQLSKRLNLALDYAWEVTKAKFRDGRIEVEKEDPLQHHYARSLSDFADLLSTKREENWLVDLESKEHISAEKNQHSSVDVTCEVRDGSDDSPFRASIELKMKKKSSGSTAAVVRCLKDIRRLEKLSNRSYDTGRFLMATNKSYYWEPYNGVGEDFGIHDGREIRAGERLEPRNKTQRKQLGDMDFLMLENDLRFEWDDLDMDYRFLSVRIG